MTLQGQKSVNRQFASNWGLRRPQNRNSNQVLPLKEEGLRIRVILHAHHPWNEEVKSVGKVIVLPKSMKELLKVASKWIDFPEFTILFS